MSTQSNYITDRLKQHHPRPLMHKFFCLEQ